MATKEVNVCDDCDEEMDGLLRCKFCDKIYCEDCREDHLLYAHIDDLIEEHFDDVVD